MSKTIEISRELLQRWVDNTDFFEDLRGKSMAEIDKARKEDDKITEELRTLLAAPAVERQEPISCDAANEENAQMFMGEPIAHHSIDWYREGITKHWKTICSQRAQIETLSESLRFYAGRDHYSTDDGLNWDSCSGEPMNILWHESEPWFIEDGSVARASLDKVEELNQ